MEKNQTELEYYYYIVCIIVRYYKNFGIQLKKYTYHIFISFYLYNVMMVKMMEKINLHMLKGTVRQLRVYNSIDTIFYTIPYKLQSQAEGRNERLKDLFYNCPS